MGRVGRKERRGEDVHQCAAHVADGYDAILFAVQWLGEQAPCLADLGLLPRRDLVLSGKLRRAPSGDGGGGGRGCAGRWRAPSRGLQRSRLVVSGIGRSGRVERGECETSYHCCRWLSCDPASCDGATRAIEFYDEPAAGPRQVEAVTVGSGNRQSIAWSRGNPLLKP